MEADRQPPASAKLRAITQRAKSKAADKTDADPLDRAEAEQYDAEARQIDIDLKKADLVTRAAERGLRETYASKVFRFLCSYSTVVFVILLFQGFGIWEFDLDRYVLLALVGSTAISVVGVVGFVVRGLFPSVKR